MQTEITRAPRPAAARSAAATRCGRRLEDRRVARDDDRLGPLQRLELLLGAIAKPVVESRPRRAPAEQLENS